MEHRVGWLVEKLWPEITRVAYGLLERGRLSDEQVNEILNGNDGA